MNPFARLTHIRKAVRLYDALLHGDTALLNEYFPFVKVAFTPKIVPHVAPPLRKPLEPPKITYRTRSDEEDLHDALDIGFGELKFDQLDED
jgi:hypothetical protein